MNATRSDGDELVCFQRNEHEHVPGCFGGLQDISRSDYCVRKSDLNSGSTLEDIPLKYTAEFPLARCEGNYFNSTHHFSSTHFHSLTLSCTLALLLGDCDSNNDCVGDLICFQRNGNAAVPGCIGGENDGSRTDYCVSPSSSVPPPQTPELRVQWSTIFPLTHCQGKTHIRVICAAAILAISTDSQLVFFYCNR